MRSTWMGATLALIGLVGCDSGDDKRTYMACGNADACAVMQSDVPARMSCAVPEVGSCSTDGVLGTCQVDELVLHTTVYVYAADMLTPMEQDCVSEGGTWTLAAN